MWLQIVFSALLAIVAVRFVMFTSKSEMVRVLADGQDFSVRYPRLYLSIAVVLYLVMASVVLSLIVWSDPDILGIVAACALGAVGTIYLLRALVWRVEVRRDYLIFVSSLGVKRLVHYEDISSAQLESRSLEIRTPIKTFKMSARVIYLEDLLFALADHGVPVYRG